MTSVNPHFVRPSFRPSWLDKKKPPPKNLHWHRKCEVAQECGGGNDKPNMLHASCFMLDNSKDSCEGCA